jgi:hypothetical protein
VDRHLCLAARFRQPAGEDCELQIGARRVKPWKVYLLVPSSRFDFSRGIVCRDMKGEKDMERESSLKWCEQGSVYPLYDNQGSPDCLYSGGCYLQN